MKPMLAASLEDIDSVQLPAYVSDKEDGIRCLLVESVRQNDRRMAYSRSLKPIANIYIRRQLTDSFLPLGFDGELISGNFQQTASAIMSACNCPDFTYNVFDFIGDGMRVPFHERYAKLCGLVTHYTPMYPWLKLVEHKLVTTKEELLAAEADALARGKEGLMIRKFDGPYKYGRSTLKQQWLLKLKRFTDAEAQVIGFTELCHNANVSTTNALGYTERSSDAANQIPSNTLGALIVKDVKTGIPFSIGTGFTEVDRRHIWRHRTDYLHKILTYKYQNFGIKVAPRSPVFLRWRPDYNL